MLAEGLFAGDPCLVVIDGGIKDLAPGDLILEANGIPAAGTLWVEGVKAGDPAERAGIGPFHAVTTIDGVDRPDAFVWNNYAPEKTCRVEAVFGAESASFLCTATEQTLAEQSGLRAAPLERLLADTVAPRTVTLRALSGGREKTVTIGGGEVAGIRSEATAYPLVCTDANLAGTIPFRLDGCAPGSYLLVVKADGKEDLRLPVLVPRRRRASLEAELRPAGDSPPGFVRVAGGIFTCGGDREALLPQEEKKRNVPEFWMARGEVTIGEWFEFINDREIAIEVTEAMNVKRPVFLPRYWQPDPRNPSGPEILTLLAVWDGREDRWKSLIWSDPSIPAVGMSRDDIGRFLDWKNERARKNGEPWRYSIPSQDEWEKAARGVDKRFYPWGDRFDFTFCKSLYAHSKKLFPETFPKLRRLEPGRSYPVDESVYGVRDLAGSVIEWNSDIYGRYYYSTRGGQYDGDNYKLFRAATRDRFKPDVTAHTLGFRLIARPLY
jgi:formylglycine-generating enzyme required for sulfatase activity